MWESLSCLLRILESFDKNNPEMGTDSVARQMHQKTAQHYWVNIVKQQVTGGECPTLRDTSKSNAHLNSMEKKSSETAASKQKPKEERRWTRKEAKGSQCAGKRSCDRATSNAQ